MQVIPWHNRPSTTRARRNKSHCSHSPCSLTVTLLTDQELQTQGNQHHLSIYLFILNKRLLLLLPGITCNYLSVMRNQIQQACLKCVQLFSEIFIFPVIQPHTYKLGAGGMKGNLAYSLCMRHLWCQAGDAP